MSVEIRRFSEDVDMVFSPDDGGWYGQDHVLDVVTHLVYEDIDDLEQALRAGGCDWEPA